MSILSYLLVAIGGALGSVARAWISVQMVAWVGPRFPWGTIGINVLGSFAIALFGSLTVADARLPVSAEVRAFVMVGLCGGFTTFSSFSLQTLDLAREGRVAAALANVALSVAVCVAAAALGLGVAASFNGAAPHRGAAAEARDAVAVDADPRGRGTHAGGTDIDPHVIT